MKKNWNDFEILRNMIMLANLASKDVWVLGPPCPSTLQPAHFLHQATRKKREKNVINSRLYSVCVPKFLENPPQSLSKNLVV